MTFKLINPESLGSPRGYSNGVMSDAGGKLLFIAGQVAWDEHQNIVSQDFVDQFDRALENLLAVVAAAGGQSSDVARMVVYVTSKNEYRERTPEIGERYRARMGRHFPAMVLVEVSGLLEEAAKVEIEGIAVING
jgi:enamine deaminase RidA (YjgF/YER057c/UK114 family)